MCKSTLIISGSTSVLEFADFLKREFSLHPRCARQSLTLDLDAVFSLEKQKPGVFEIDEDTLAEDLVRYLMSNYQIDLEIRNGDGVKVAGDTRMSEGCDMQLADEVSTQTLQGCIKTSISLGNTVSYSSIDQMRGVLHRGSRLAMCSEDRKKLIDAVFIIANKNKSLSARDIVSFLSIICSNKADIDYSKRRFVKFSEEIVELIVKE